MSVPRPRIVLVHKLALLQLARLTITTLMSPSLMDLNTAKNCWILRRKDQFLRRIESFSDGCTQSLNKFFA